MSIFRDFFNSNVPKIDLFSPSYKDNVQFCRNLQIFVNLLTISQNFISISLSLKVIAKKLWGAQPSPLGLVRVDILVA